MNFPSPNSPGLVNYKGLKTCLPDVFLNAFKDSRYRLKDEILTRGTS